LDDVGRKELLRTLVCLLDKEWEIDSRHESLSHNSKLAKNETLAGMAKKGRGGKEVMT
jgi:hypothetical protein